MLIFIDFRVGNIRMCIDPENAEVVILFIQVCKGAWETRQFPPNVMILSGASLSIALTVSFTC